MPDTSSDLIGGYMGRVRRDERAVAIRRTTKDEETINRCLDFSKGPGEELPPYLAKWKGSTIPSQDPQITILDFAASPSTVVNYDKYKSQPSTAFVTFPMGRPDLTEDYALCNTVFMAPVQGLQSIYDVYSATDTCIQQVKSMYTPGSGRNRMSLLVQDTDIFKGVQELQGLECNLPEGCTVSEAGTGEVWDTAKIERSYYDAKHSKDTQYDTLLGTVECYVPVSDNVGNSSYKPLSSNASVTNFVSRVLDTLMEYNG